MRPRDPLPPLRGSDLGYVNQGLAPLANNSRPDRG
jgi:hypothetical protein